MKNPARKESVQSSASAHNTLLCMFQRLCTYFQDTRVLIFGGYVLLGHCNQQQISVKTEGVLIFGGVLIYGVLRYVASAGERVDLLDDYDFPARTITDTKTAFVQHVP